MNPFLTCFVHVPSAGGTTLWSILRRASSKPVKRFGEESYADNEERARRLISTRAAEFSVIGGHVRHGFYDLSEPPIRYFTFLRHPVERLVSAYYRKIRNGKHTPPSERAFQSGEDLLEFARPRHQGDLAFLLGSERAMELSAAGGVGPLRSAIHQVKSGFVFVGVLEEFDTSVHFLARELGWTRVPQYELRNRGGNKLPLPAEVRRELERLLAVDVALYQHFREALLGRSRRDAPAAQAARFFYRWRGVAERGVKGALVPGYSARYLKR